MKWFDKSSKSYVQKNKLKIINRFALQSFHRKLLKNDEISKNEDFHEFSVFNKDIRSIFNLKNVDFYIDVNVSARMWNFIWLHSMIFINFAIVFAVMFITMIIFYHFFEIHHDLKTQAFKNYYSWKYNLTVCKHVHFMSFFLSLINYIIFVIIINLWR